MTTFFEKMKDLLVRDPYPTVGCPIAGVGPTTVTLRIDGHSGTAGYQPHGRVEVSYYDRNLNQVTEQTYPIGGGYQPSLIQIETGSTRVRTHSQNITVAASAQADKNRSAHRS